MNINYLKSRIWFLSAFLSGLVFCLFLCSHLLPIAFEASADEKDEMANRKTEPTVRLRICNWEEYMDEGNWQEDDVINLASGDIFGKKSLITEYEQWYEKTYGVQVKVEYSNFGTNEDLYNMLTLGDTFDLICPSEYMFMKLMSEDALTALSPDFFDADNEYNYYIKGVSPYLKQVFDSHKIGGESWSRYAAGYMWGITGFIYNPEYISKEMASTWRLMTNPSVKRRVTVKDNVRDSYFAAVGALHSEELTSEAFLKQAAYKQRLEDVMNNTSSEEIERVQAYLQKAKDNVYAFETDSGKADMITGKVSANYQWSGDAVYSMDQAEADDVYLNFAVPEESTNIYFDGWVMLKNGIAGDRQKQHAAEAFINFISRPDNAIRNMYYIGYTSFISGGEDKRILEYLKWNYAAKEESTDTILYDISYFFTGDTKNSEPQYVLTVEAKQADRQLSAQYPSPEVMRRSAVMRYFTPAQNAAVNRMWVNVRCYNLNQMSPWGWAVVFIGLILVIWLIVHKIIRRKK